MEKAAIYHQPFSSYAYGYDSQTLHIKIRSKRDDIQAVVLIAADPYLQTEGGWASKETVLRKIATTEEHDYWFVAIKPEQRRLQYAFVLTDATEETVFYGGRGFYDDTPENRAIMDYYFKFPFLHETEVFKAPEWVKETIWYQIFPERFDNGNPELSPANVLPWGSKDPGRDDFFGGDIAGIIGHLDYLAELGINGIYLTPVFEASTNHKYDTLNYFEIDPHFGDKETFRKLVKEAHERGIKIMLDAVFNHIGDKSPEWQDVLKNGEKLKFVDWFHIRSFPVTPGENGNIEGKNTLSFDTFAYTMHMPKLNTANPEVQKYLLEIATYWVREFDIDGWRLDVANEVDHAFWKQFNQAVRAEKEDIYILGEIWHDSWLWLLGDEFDSVMNYPFTQTIIENFVEERIKPTKMVSGISEQLMRYQEQVNHVMFNMLDSHDTARLLTRCEGDKEKAKLALAFMFAHTGSPCIYYGTEIGMDGADDPLCRKCMEWDETKQDKEMLTFMKKLIAFRKTNQKTLTYGDLVWHIVDDENRLVAFSRTFDNKRLTFIFNQDSISKTIQKADLEIANEAWNAWTKGVVKNIEVAAKSFTILES
ncbi:glycoside hydrolase family 13 protein [Listeria cornellensis]|uniref:Neopullulanase n=1 Tax=Listeria cornellensis FSL F6-0969 TaxID=1265820 RepID=W7C969_9LIST|nr:glycoside hydrolase family 13 protein [Listeria cornellensis]EUJ32246.1 neopullulanase [Listeria cornellensis FSL F6-0969]